ncbi:MAG: hypothetical protein ACYDH6_23865 [Acidimicrobiales bacterium]
MPLDPRLQSVVDAASAAAPADTRLPLETLRASANRSMEATLQTLTEPAPPVAATADHRVPVDGEDIMLRVYTPEGEPPFPAHLHTHGGGFWFGTVAHFDPTCR